MKLKKLHEPILNVLIQVALNEQKSLKIHLKFLKVGFKSFQFSKSFVFRMNVIVVGVFEFNSVFRTQSTSMLELFLRK